MNWWLSVVSVLGSLFNCLVKEVGGSASSIYFSIDKQFAKNKEKIKSFPKVFIRIIILTENLIYQFIFEI